MTDEQLIKQAKAQYMREWRQDHPDRYKAYQKLWRENNKDRQRELNDRYWLKRAKQQMQD